MVFVDNGFQEECAFIQAKMDIISTVIGAKSFPEVDCLGKKPVFRACFLENRPETPAHRLRLFFQEKQIQRYLVGEEFARFG